MRKRENLYFFRIKKHLTLQAMAQQIGCSVSCYSKIENNEREGGLSFWRKFQHNFNIPGAEMWQYINDEKTTFTP